MINRKKGFTLLEVLIALVIIAISFTAVLHAEMINTHDANYIQDKTAANWVAMNVVNSIQLHLIDAQAPATLDNKMEMFGRTWYWQASVDSTDDDAIDSIKVMVSTSANASPLITITGFMQGQPS